MVQEPPKVSTEDEAKQIFEAARLNVGGINNSALAPVSEESPVGNEAEVSSREVELDSGEHNLPYSDDDRLKVTPASVVPDGNVSAGHPGDAEDSDLVRDAAASDSDHFLADPILLQSAPKIAAVATDERLRESPRDAFRRLQDKVDDARRSGFLE